MTEYKEKGATTENLASMGNSATNNGRTQPEKQKGTGISWSDLVKVLPQIGWLALAAVLIYWFHGPILKTFEQNNIAKLGVAGVQVEFVQKQVQQAASSKSQSIPPALKDRIERTAKRLFEASILWVDDNPANNLAERRAFTSLGITIDTAKSTDEALKYLATGTYQIIISDEHRDEKNSALCFGGDDTSQPANEGCFFMREVKKTFENMRKKMPPLIFYSSFVDPEWGTPVYAFGATTRVDELFHLVLDALERQPASTTNGK